MATPTSNPPPQVPAERVGALADEPRSGAGGAPPEPVTQVAAPAPTDRGVTLADAAHPPQQTNGHANGATSAVTVPPTHTPPAPTHAPPAAVPARSAGSAHAPAPAPAGRALPDMESAAAYRAKTNSRRKRFLLLIPILLIALGVTTIFGYRYWYQTTYSVSTENA